MLHVEYESKFKLWCAKRTTMQGKRTHTKMLVASYN